MNVGRPWTAVAVALGAAAAVSGCPPHAWRLALVLAALLTLVSGCGRFYWSKPGAALDEFNRDSAGCAREASPAYGILVEEAYRRCLAARGWTRAQQQEPVPSGWYRGIE